MNAEQPENGSGDRYRFDAQMIRLPAGDGLELLHSELTGMARLVPSQDVRLLQHCGNFATQRPTDYFCRSRH
jgi:hypothetical protein